MTDTGPDPTDAHGDEVAEDERFPQAFGPEELLDHLLDRIAAAPDGPGVAAVFDYDGTLIDGFSGVAYVADRARNLQFSVEEAARMALTGVRGVRTAEEYQAFLDWSMKSFTDRKADELWEWATGIFQRDISRKLRPESWALLQAHRAKGHTIVIASSATNMQIMPIAETIGADHVLCTQLEVVDGILTGRVAGQPLWSEHKAAAVVELAVREGIDLTESFAYADGNEDVPLLSAVGNPTAVNPHPHMRRTAEAESWPILDGARTSASPSVKSVARTLGALYGWAGGTAIAAAMGVVRGSKRTFIDTAMDVGSDLALTLGGIDVDIVEGREHLWAHRPCVFIFNHRSNLDGLILMNVLEEGITAVAKHEIKRWPIIGQLFSLGGVAFVDRTNSAQAREALKPAVEAIRTDGLSMALAPEGTRWRTPGMGPFKKGAFHIARQAGVPVVPIVIKGAGTLLPRGGQLLKSGRIEVTVLPAVDVATWGEDEIGERAEEVRHAMLEALMRRG